MSGHSDGSVYQDSVKPRCGRAGVYPTGVMSIMRTTVRSLIAAAVFSLMACAPHSSTLVVAHRGASAYLPEHTLAAYALAYGMGADAIEPDVVLTRDGVLVCSHDTTIHNEEAMRRAFPGRARADGKWYFIDLDLAELRSVGTPLGRNAGNAEGMTIATLDEIITLVQRLNETTGRRVEIVPEAKSPAFHRREGKPIEGALVAALEARGYRSRADGAVVQCFELESLRTMRHELNCDLRLVYLVGEPVSDAVLDDVASFADGIGPSRKLIVNDDGSPGKQPDLVEKARSRGLAVYAYTFGADEAMVRRFVRIPGVTGVFTDNPDVAVRVRDGR